MDEYQMMGLTYRAYVAALIILGALCIFQRKEDARKLWQAFLALPPIKRTATVMVGNLIANLLFVTVSGIHDPWLWYIGIDTLSALLVLWQPAWIPQGVIGGLYTCQIAMHAIYKASGTVSENRYWVILIALAIAQVFMLGGWYIGIRGRALLGRWRHHRMAGAKGASGG